MQKILWMVVQTGAFLVDLKKKESIQTQDKKMFKNTILIFNSKKK